MAESSAPKNRIKLVLWAAAIGAITGAVAVRFRDPHNRPLPHNFHDAVASAAQRGFTWAMLISLLLWIAFSFYWEAAARNASQTKTSESRLSRGFHLALISTAQLLVLFPVPGLRMHLLPASTALAVTGLTVQAAFFVLAIWARRRLGRNWSGAVTTKVDHELIRTGPYRVVRHPIYTAMLGVYLGTALVSGEIRGLVGVVLACLAYWRKIRMEEKYMSDLFGPAYTEYQSETWAVIPGVV